VNEDKASRYHRLKRTARIVSVALTAALAVAFVSSGASAWWRDRCLTLAHAAWPLAGGEWAAVALLYVTGVAFAAELVGLPLAWYGGHVVERRYGMTTLTLAGWARDHVKGGLLGFGLGVAATLVVFGAMEWSPAWWWAPAAAVVAVASVAMTWLAPVIVFPLFFRFKPLERPELAARLAVLARRAGAEIRGAFEWSLGDRTRAANAALVGMGATRRIILSDTLLAQYSDEEIEVILAHELAHHVHGDLWRILGADALLTVGALLVAHLALMAAEGWGGLRGVGDVAALPVLLLAAGAWSLLTMPVVNGLSRAHERRADRFALDLTANPDAFVSAMRRLGAQNLADEYPSPLVEALFHSHPPLPQRIAAARAWRGSHLSSTVFSSSDPAEGPPTAP